MGAILSEPHKRDIWGEASQSIPPAMMSRTVRPLLAAVTSALLIGEGPGPGYLRARG
jgi:hypothetical protein